MGLSFRKSIKAGPFRFNLSGSGIGVSVGVPGFRVGTGPRGNYVSISAGGFTYRQSLGQLGGNAPAQTPSFSEARQEFSPAPGDEYIPSGSSTVAPLKVIASGDVGQLSDTDSASLVDEINGKRAKIPVWYLPLVLLGAVWWTVTGTAGESGLSPLVTGAFIAAFLVVLTATFWLYMWDAARRSTVIFYDFDEQAERVYEEVVSAFSVMQSCRGAWHVLASGRVLDGRYNAGAGHTITRKTAILSKGGVTHVKCNIDVPWLSAGKKAFYFYPDRVFITEGSRVAVCKYDSLTLSTQLTRFIEDGVVPSDSKVVGHTWRFVNKNGTPDRRFNNNRQLPIAQYEELHLSSAQGVQELYQLSNVGTAAAFVRTVSQLVQYQKNITQNHAA
jgi:hypothetical protein